MQSFDLDFPSGLNSYITAPQLGDYMIQYVDHFNLRRFFRRSVNSVKSHFYESFYRNKYDTIWYSMIIWINVDYPMIFYDLWYPMILGSNILAKFYSHQPSYNRSTNHVRLQVTPFWLGGTEVDDAWCGVENLKYQWRNIYLPDKSEYLQAKWVFWHTVFWTHTIPYPIWPTLPLITDPGFQSRVESVALEGDAWRVTSRALTTTEAVQSESFDAVCVANGHWDVVISGQPRFH